MTPELLAAHFATDIDLVKHGIECIEVGTRLCTLEQLRLLHQAGEIPTGIYNYLVAIRS